MLKKIRELAAEKGVSLAEVERKCGLGKRSISKWDVSEPSVSKAQAVADFFGVSVNELLEDGEHD